MMNTSSKNVNEQDETSSISLVCYSKQDTENNDYEFLDDANQEKGQVEKFQLIEDPHKYDELIDSIQVRDLERLKNSMEKLCKNCFIHSLLENINLNNDL